MTIKLIATFLLLTLAATQYAHWFYKEDADIERVKNNSRMEDFYCPACKDKDDCVRDFTCNLLENAAGGKACGANCMSYWRRDRARTAELLKALEDAGDPSAIKVIRVWRSELGGRRKAWIAECATTDPQRRLYLHFVKYGQGLVLDEVN